MAIIVSSCGLIDTYAAQNVLMLLLGFHDGSLIGDDESDTKTISIGSRFESFDVRTIEDRPATVVGEISTVA
jgi:hypothetical protein